MIPTPAETTLETLRRLLLGLPAFGLIGTTTDLLLLGHYEDELQFIPFAMIGIALVVRAKAPPAMAPATLVLLDLLGLVAAYRNATPAA